MVGTAVAVIAVARLALLERLYTKTRDRLPRDARVFQIVFLAALLTTGVLLRDFSVQSVQIALAFAAGLATQTFWLKRLGLQQKGLLSAIVTCCGLSLLLRSDTLWAHPVAAALAMSSKFVLRINGKRALGVLEKDPQSGFVVMRRLAALIARHLATAGPK